MGKQDPPNPPELASLPMLRESMTKKKKKKITNTQKLHDMEQKYKARRLHDKSVEQNSLEWERRERKELELVGLHERLQNNLEDQEQFLREKEVVERELEATRGRVTRKAKDEIRMLEGRLNVLTRSLEGGQENISKLEKNKIADLTSKLDEE